MATRTLTYVLLGKDNLSPVVRKAGAETEGASRRMSTAMAAVNAAFVLTGLAVVDFGVHAVKAAINFQSSMEKIHTQAGASQKSVESLSAAVLKMGVTAQQSPQQLADALYHLKSVGMDNVDAMKALKQASDLAAVGGANLEDTTNALAGAWRSGIKGAQSFGQTAATVNAIIGAGNMRMSEFTAAIGTGILPSAKTFGVSLASIGSALALMTDEGIPANEAATRLRMTLSLMGAPSAKAEKQLHAIGLTGLQLAETMRGPGGLVAAIGLLKDHLDASGLSASRQAQVISHAFGGGRSSSAIMTLLNNLEVLRRKQKQINGTMGSFGDAVIKQRQTAQAQFALLKSAFDVLSINMGTALLPPLVKFAQYINNSAIPAIRRFSTEATPYVKKAFAYFFTGLAAISKGFDSLPGPVRIATAAIVLLGIAMKIAAANPWTALALAIIIVVGVIVKHWRLINSVFDEVRNAILDKWRVFTGMLASGFDAIRDKAVSVWHAIEDNFFGKFLIVAMKIWFDATKFMLTLFWDLISGIFLLVINLGEKMWKALVELWKIEWVILKPLLTAIGVVVSVVFLAILKVVTVVWKAVGALFKLMWDAILHPAINALWTTISTVFGWIIHAAASAFGWIPGLGGKLKDAARSFDAFKNQVNTALGGLNDKKINVSVAMSSSSNPYPGGISGRKAGGGPITGPGGPTSDRAGLFALSHGEWVVKAASAAKYGSGAMNAVNSGKAVIGYADGGPVGHMAGGGGVSVATHIPSAGSIGTAVWAQLVKLVKSGSSNLFGSSGGTSGMIHGNFGSGVAQWTGLVLKALSMLGLSASFAPRVLYQMQTESGGNPNAINLTDSNAAAGDPSRGLLQTIMSTFLAYHVGGTSMNIYDPLANIAAAINYAQHRYGPSLESGGMGMGSGHGYAMGTNSARRGFAWVGEHGPELINFRGGEGVTPNNRISTGHTTIWTGDVIIQGNALASKAQLARTVTEAIEYSQRHGNK